MYPIILLISIYTSQKPLVSKVIIDTLRRIPSMCHRESWLIDGRRERERGRDRGRLTCTRSDYYVSEINYSRTWPRLNSHQHRGFLGAGWSVTPRGQLGGDWSVSTPVAPIGSQLISTYTHAHLSLLHGIHHRWNISARDIHAPWGSLVGDGGPHKPRHAITALTCSYLVIF